MIEVGTNWVYIASGDGLLSDRQMTIARIRADFLSNRISRQIIEIFSEFESKHHYFMSEKCFWKSFVKIEISRCSFLFQFQLFTCQECCPKSRYERLGQILLSQSDFGIFPINCPCHSNFLVAQHQSLCHVLRSIDLWSYIKTWPRGFRQTKTRTTDWGFSHGWSWKTIFLIYHSTACLQLS